MRIEVASLYCGSGSHDKVYNIQLLPAGAGLWNVLAQYGGRGKGLTHITKVAKVSWRAAHKKYIDILEEKLHKPRDPYHHVALAGESLAHKDDTVPGPAPSKPLPEPTWEGWDAEYAAAATALSVSLSPGLAPEPFLVLLADLAMGMQDGLVDAMNLAARTRSLESSLSPACLTWFESLPTVDQRSALSYLHERAQSAATA